MMIKKLSAFFLALCMLCCIGCGKYAGSARKEIPGSLEEIMQNIYAGTDLELPMLGNTVITDENKAYFFGTSDVPMTEGLASEAMISAIAHSVCLFRVPVDSDVSAIKNTLRDNVNPNKWICVGVNDEDVIVDSVGNLVVLIMADDAETLHKSFLALAE